MSARKWNKPSKELLEKYHVDYKYDTVFSSRARLLQSVWREEHLQLEEMGVSKGGYYLGNYLPLEIAEQKKLNFLSGTISRTVQDAIRNKEEQSLIMKPRIWNNMLSSQPLCFNLFAEMKQNLPLASELFSTLFPDRVIKVEEIKFEYSPGKSNNKFINDRSAFDVFVTYKSCDHKNGFIGIEVKYAEHMSDSESSHKERYEEVMSDSGLFKDDQLINLKKSPIQQIWRDHLLALSMYKSNPDYYDEGMFVLLYPKENCQCSAAIEKYKNTFLVDDEAINGFYPRTLEEIVTILKNHCNDQWINDFYDRYLNFSKIDELETGL